MIMTTDANNIRRLMGLTILQVGKDFKSHRLLRIFGRPNGISKNFVKYMNHLGMSGYSVSARNYPYGYSCDKNCKAVGTKYSRNIRENFMVYCNNKINWD